MGAIGLDLRFFQVRSRHLRCLEGILDERVQNSCFQYAELSSVFNVWRRVNHRERTQD